MNNMYIPANNPEDWQQLLTDPEKQWKTGDKCAESARYREDEKPCNFVKLQGVSNGGLWATRTPGLWFRRLMLVFLGVT